MGKKDPDKKEGFIHINATNIRNKKDTVLAKKIILIFTLVLMIVFLWNFIYTMTHLTKTNEKLDNKSSFQRLIKLIAFLAISVALFFIPRKDPEVIILLVITIMHTIKHGIFYAYITRNDNC
jgi:hypothetical protein